MAMIDEASMRYIGLGVDEPCKACDGAGWV